MREPHRQKEAQIVDHRWGSCRFQRVKFETDFQTGFPETIYEYILRVIRNILKFHQHFDTYFDMYMHFQISLKLTNIVVIVVSYYGINEVFLNVLCNSVICIKVFYNSCSSTFVRSAFISSKLIIRGESIDERIPTKTD